MSSKPHYTPVKDPISTKGKSRILKASLTLFLGIQLYPLIAYYGGDYPWDERFSWRMFSSIRSLKCSVQAWESDPIGKIPCPSGSSEHLKCNQVRLSSDVHMVWINLLKRGRRSVLDHLVRRRCTKYPTRALFVSLQCPLPDQNLSPIFVQRPEVNLCAK